MISTQKYYKPDNSVEEFFTISILLFVLFLPDIRLSSSFAARPEDILILLSFIYLCYKRIIFDTFFTRIIIFMAIVMFVSIGLNNRLLSLNSFEFYNKIIKGMVAYNICLLYMQDSEGYHKISKILIVSIAILAVLNILQLAKIPGLSKVYGIYSNQIQMDAFDKVSLSSSIPRITGLIGNPNNNATFFLIILGYVLDVFFLTRRKAYIVLIVACIIIIMLTQSRTMFATTGGLFAIVLCLTGNIAIIFFAAIIYFIIQILDIRYLALIFDSGKLSQTHSFTGRINEWEVLLKMIKLQPILGYGGYKEYFYITQTYPENEYILGWFRYGAIYLCLYCYMFVHLLFNGIVRALNKFSGGYFMLSTSLAMIIGSISNTPFNNPRLFVLFAFVNAFFASGRLHEEV